MISVVLLFLMPLLYLAQKQDAITQNYVMTETISFVDAIKNNGFLTEKMYSIFLKKLAQTDGVYQIKMEHAHKTLNLLEEIEAEGMTKEYYYNFYETDILEQLYGEEGIYYFTQGDYISIKVVNQNKTLSAKLQQIIYCYTVPDIQIYVTYGGMIRDENY